MMTNSPGKVFRQALLAEKPLQIVGAINAYSALLAEKVGFKALYLSGAGVANASYALPDLGITSLNDVLTDLDRITSATNLPVLVDIDTGWGGAFNIAKTVRQMIKYRAAAVHLEDQSSQKRCGHRPNKEIVAAQEMVDRIKAAVDAKTDPDFVIIARTDSFAQGGLSEAIERSQLYVQAGADMLFPEAFTNLADYTSYVKQVKVPVLANITEFGKTPMLTTEQLKNAGVAMALYPLSAFRAMNAAALKVYQTLRKDGTQQAVLDSMQNREDLYQYLNYHQYEQTLDRLFEKKKDT